jgi:hypothetical protein
MVFGSLLWWYSHLHEEVGHRRELESKLRRECVELDRLETLAARKHEEQQILDKQVAFLECLSQSRGVPLSILSAVSATVDNERGISITHLSQVGPKVLLKGKAFDLKTIVDLVLNLRSSEIFESAEPKQWETEERLICFEVLCVLRN